MNCNFLVLVSVVLLFTSCDRKFDSDVWKQYGGELILTDMRESMVSDILESDLFLGKNIAEIELLLGDKYRMTDSSMIYIVREKYGTNIDPIYIKRLHVLIDSTGKAERLVCDKIK